MQLARISRRLLKSLLLIASAIGCGCVSSQAPSLPDDNPVSFSAVTVTEGDDPHAYGFKVGLCYAAGVANGILFKYGGLVADPFRARLENLSYDNATGDIEFEANIVDGVGMSEISKKWEPVRNHVSVSGRVNEKKIAGTIIQTLGERQTARLLPSRESHRKRTWKTCRQYHVHAG